VVDETGVTAAIDSAGAAPAAPGTDPAQLRFIDAPEIDIMASPERCWLALTSVVGGGLGGTPARAVATALRCGDRSAHGPLDEPGSTLAGFHVGHGEPPWRWHLEGTHRFSRYSLEFRLQELASDRSRLSAESRAVFPGWHGAVYRTLVIGSGGHRVAVGRMLRSVKRRAEADAGRADGTARPLRG
jgi:hypothetical protein